jgi:hypothetical protein
MTTASPSGRLVILLAVLAAEALAAGGPAAEERRNWFDDPFAQATQGLAGCPRPLGPLITESEMRRQAHGRIERGNSCYLAGRCAEPNAYARDHEINAAVAHRLGAEARLGDTRLWVITQRGFVFLQGCVRTRAQIALAVAIARAVPGVEHVGDELMVGTRGRPPYETAPR